MSASNGPTTPVSATDIFDLVMFIRIADMERMCSALAEQCKERGNESMYQRLDRASASCRTWLEEIKRKEEKQHVEKAKQLDMY